ncbi:unnamed protein product [Thelazia callipaeda]|uniref:ELYS-bb domain-containing protein n=1 Tax=Thelazia callipaeda TaxID=103827 RepID=A0A0N5D045_THECL|nr:unnamed protein product [Thelazia callipaeda]
MLRQEGTVKDFKLLYEKKGDEAWGNDYENAGEYTEWYCFIRKNYASIHKMYHTSPVVYSCGFGKSCSIADVCGLAFQDGSMGVVLAVNDEQNEEYFLAYYSIKVSKIVKNISVRKKISRIAAILDGTKKEEIHFLHENLRKSPHLIAVGTHGGDCYLTHFGIDMPDMIDSKIERPPFTTNLCKSYISQEQFNFVTNNGKVFSINIGKFKLLFYDLYVSAVSYLERCKTLVIGFSCGAFIAVSLLNGKDGSYYHSSSSVYGFACQEPVDDPRPVLYLWVAYSKRKQNPHAMLFVITFPNDEGQPSSQWSFSEFMIMKYLVWYPDNCSKWLSFRTIVSFGSKEHQPKNILERFQRFSLRSSSTEEILRINAMNTIHMLMTWKNTNNSVEACIILLLSLTPFMILRSELAIFQGALFDLNAFYYKRLPRQIMFDQSVLKLNPFLAVFKVKTLKDQEADFDYLVNHTGVWQYQSPYSETDDFFIFAPSHSFEINVFNRNYESTILISSIQKVVLNWIDSNFGDIVLEESELACSLLNAVGLAKTYADHSGTSEISVVPFENVSVIISALIFNDESNKTLKNYIISCSSYAIVHRISGFIWKEIIHAKKKFDELSRPWFDHMSRPLSLANLHWLQSSAAVFHRAEELFVEISKKVPSDKIMEAATASYNMMVAKNLVFYTGIVFLFYHIGLLPLKNFTSLYTLMKTKIIERKGRLLPGSKLYITTLLEEMQTACPEEDFWFGCTADEWYPPQSFEVSFNLFNDMIFNT